jgi:dihydroorotate dehydrogenase
MYKLLRSALFKFDAENVHHWAMSALGMAVRTPLVSSAMSNLFSVRDQKLERTVFGLKFPNPVGLGAGFDKNARYLKELSVLGFGFVEIGTITPRAQDGNEKPRLFRLPADRALINRMGFNNEGVEAAARRLATWKDKNASDMIIGGNIGKNKSTPNEDAWRDYDICFRRLHELADYFVVNVSSPNTPGLRELQEKDALSKILSNLQNINAGIPQRKPLLLKIAPDLTEGQLEDIVALAGEVKLDGLVATNTTISRAGLSAASTSLATSIGAGGLSGAPLRVASTDILKRIVALSGGQIPVIASGGIFTAADAREKMESGASLVQLWTGFVYEGPSAASKICRGLLQNNC